LFGTNEQPKGTLRTYPAYSAEEIFRQAKIVGVHLVSKCERIVVYEDGIIEQSDGLINPKP